MEKRYYYLNRARTAPLGPHTLAELVDMLRRGELSPAVEIAAVGDSRWVALSKVLAGSELLLPPIPEQAEVPPDLPPVPTDCPPTITAAKAGGDLPPVPGYSSQNPVQGTACPPLWAMSPLPVADAPAGYCPACAQELVTEGGQLPPNCPHCGAYLRPVQNTLWRHIRAALLRPLTWHGRSPRVEYWGAFLFYLLSCTPIALAAISVIIIFTTRELNKHPVAELSFDQVAYAPDMVWAWVAAGVLALCMLYFTLVSIAVGIRRLHDIGRSGWWLGAMLTVNLAWLTTYVRTVVAYISTVNWQLIIAIEDTTSRNNRINEISDHISLLNYEGLCGVLYLLNIGLSLTLLVFSFMDSKPGPNKYGPCPKYPIA